VKQTVKIDIWSDLACPWCYVGKHRLEAALETLAQQEGAPEVVVEYHSFQLAPDMPEDFPGSHDEYLSGRYGWSSDQVAASNRQLEQVGEPLGITFDFATNRIANTRKAHELLHLAKQQGRQPEMKERLLRAHFSDGVHIGHGDDLADLAAEVGLDRADVTRALDAGEFAGAVDADIETARRIGVSGVPFFVLDGKYGLSGAQEPQTFLEAIRKVAAEKETA